MSQCHGQCYGQIKNVPNITVRESIAHAHIGKMWVFRFYMIKLPFIITVQEKVTHAHIGRLHVPSELPFIITVCGNVTHARISCVYFLRLFCVFVSCVLFLCFYVCIKERL